MEAVAFEKLADGQISLVVEEFGRRFVEAQDVADHPVKRRAEEVAPLGEELVDRFGPLPTEVKGLLDVMEIKGFCRAADIAQVDAGPKGAAFRFRNDTFANPEGLIRYIGRQGSSAKIQPDHKMVFTADWEKDSARMEGVRSVVQELAKLAERGEQAQT